MQPIKEAIVLAGGFGTRLQHVVSDVPKPMAPITNLPFLVYLLEQLANANVRRVILSTGYKHECIYNFFGNRYKNIKLLYSHETEPLFTGGAIALALQHVQGENVYVLNGDTLFDIDYNTLTYCHYKNNAAVSIALHQVQAAQRYGSVDIDVAGRIKGFHEKSHSLNSGLINGGIYIVNKKWLQSLHLPKKFSFEKDILQIHYTQNLFFGIVFNGYFIDIGVPEDYQQAQIDFPQQGLLPRPPRQELTNKRFLFLDRDGVINQRIPNGYVTKKEEFVFLNGVPEALTALSKVFERIFIVTNQQGIGKGLFSENDLHQIHDHMLQVIEQAGGHIDAIYHCPHLESDNSMDRKPQAGMALRAKADFPEVDFSDSIMVGDSISDLQFASNAGMDSIFITSETPTNTQFTNYTKWVFSDLISFAKYSTFAD